MPETDKGQLKQNIEEVRRRIAEACARSGRRPSDVRLVAVTKTVDAETIRSLYELGQREIGENRVQDALRKAEELRDLADLRWHMIGHLQRNKVKKTIGLFSTIHSVDSVRLAQEIGKRASWEGMEIPVMLEVNVVGEESKFGLDPDRVQTIVEQVRPLPGISLQGLMTMAPFTDDMNLCRSVFRRLRELKDTINDRIGEQLLTELSMGMTQDFEVAVEESATFVRVGTALFKGCLH